MNIVPVFERFERSSKCALPPCLTKLARQPFGLVLQYLWCHVQLVLVSIAQSLQMPSARIRCPRDTSLHLGWGVSSSKYKDMNVTSSVRQIPALLCRITCIFLVLPTPTFGYAFAIAYDE